MKKISLVLILAVGAVACGDDGGNSNGQDGGPDAGPDLKADAPPSVDVSPDLPTQDLPAPTYTVGGTISGLVGSGLVLNNGSDTLTVAAGATTFTFVVPSATGRPYAVTVATQPTAPAQTCTVTAGAGTVAAANVMTVAIVCTTQAFTIGGTITGLTGTGLVLQNNAGDNLTVPAGAATFAFATPIAPGAAYAVTVLTQPGTPSEVCSVAAGSGTAATTNVTDVNITCSPKAFTVGGTITGLTGTGLVLQNNGGDGLTVAAAATSFKFPTPVASGGAYLITISAQPTAPAQTCTLTAATASGTVGATDVSTVAVVCSTKTFTVGGTITGLTGTGMVLRNNGNDMLTVAAASTKFTFATPLPSGSPFAVTVAAQPASPPQNCTITGGSGVIGAANVSSVVINCAVDTYTVGGQISGLVGTVVLSNGAENQTVSANGMFAFPTPIATGGSYGVSVATQPSSPSQTCTVVNGIGTIAGANVTSVAITCATNGFSVRAMVTGLAGSGLVLRNGTDFVPVGQNDTVVFPTSVPSGAGYAVSIATQPMTPSQTCTVGSSGSGVIGGSDVAVPVVCVTNSYNIRVTVSGLTGTGLILHSGADVAPVAASSTFNLPTKVLSGAGYQVTVAQQPASQICTVTPATPAIMGNADAPVSVSCMSNLFKVRGMIMGLTGSGLVLQNNGGDDKPVTAGATTFEFAASVLTGGMYNVTVKTQPLGPSQNCVPSANTGPVVDRDITTVMITCTTNLHSVIVTVMNLVGTGLVLQDNGGDNLSITGNMTVPFATKLAADQTFAVTVLTPPTSPPQACSVTPPSGPVGGADVAVTVNCAAASFAIGGKVYGAVGSDLVLHNTTPEDLPVPANSTSFAFATKVASGATYTVTVSGTPANQSCQVQGGTGPVTNADISSVVVDCAICSAADEEGTVAITCPPGQTIASFDFANYGTTTGTCGAFVTGTCHASSTDAMLATCIGKNTCSVLASNTVFNDPCPNTVKRLTVQARCH